MIRGTTPTHKYTLPVDAEMIGNIVVTYAQGGEIIVEKTKNDMTSNGKEWQVRLSQEET